MPRATPTSIQVISHRGWWLDPSEKNDPVAFKRSFAAGFGTETDVRDLGGQLVIAHDPPVDGALPFDEFLELYGRCCPARDLPLALNVKADGLQVQLRDELERFGVNTFFVFDMSVPDMLGYHKFGLPFYTRRSEHEGAPALYDAASGIWLDAFEGEWFDADTIRSDLRAGKQVCVVSPELHGRGHEALWTMLNDSGLTAESGLTICTEFPNRAYEELCGDECA
jgi:hypothetical protein